MPFDGKGKEKHLGAGRCVSVHELACMHIHLPWCWYGRGREQESSVLAAACVTQTLASGGFLKDRLKNREDASKADTL